MHGHAIRRAVRGGKARPSLISPLEMSAAGSSSLGAEKEADQGTWVCLLQEGPAGG